MTYSEKIAKGDTTLNEVDSSKEPFDVIMNHPGFLELVPIQRVSEVHPFTLGTVKDQVGPNIDTYFRFVHFMQKWLIFPSIIGIITALFNHYYDYFEDTSPLDFIYTLVIMIWSILFVTRWEEI